MPMQGKEKERKGKERKGKKRQRISMYATMQGAAILTGSNMGSAKSRIHLWLQSGVGHTLGFDLACKKAIHKREPACPCLHIQDGIE
eukprot:1161080-Pelagomonas_calceolata.AAC.11